MRSHALSQGTGPGRESGPRSLQPGLGPPWCCPEGSGMRVGEHGGREHAHRGCAVGRRQWVSVHPGNPPCRADPEKEVLPRPRKGQLPWERRFGPA